MIAQVVDDIWHVNSIAKEEEELGNRRFRGCTVWVLESNKAEAGRRIGSWIGRVVGSMPNGERSRSLESDNPASWAGGRANGAALPGGVAEVNEAGDDSCAGAGEGTTQSRAPASFETKGEEFWAPASVVWSALGSTTSVLLAIELPTRAVEALHISVCSSQGTDIVSLKMAVWELSLLLTQSLLSSEDQEGCTR